MEGNISLFHQLEHLEFADDMIPGSASRSNFLAQFHTRTAIRIPKSFATDPDKPYHIPRVEMPVEVQATLDCEGKIDRSAKNINRLMAPGEAAVETLLRDPALMVKERGSA